MLQRLFNHVIAVTFSTFGTRYGIRIRVAGMKILSPRPLDEPSVLFSGDVRSRTGVCTNVHTTLLSDRIGFEV